MTAFTKERDGLRVILEEMLQSSGTAQSLAHSMQGVPVVVGSTKGPRRKNNEDRVIAAICTRPNELGGPLFVALVCDGIGGNPLGEQSASLAVATFLETCAQSRVSSPRLALEEATYAANHAVYNLTQGMGGTTLVAVIIAPDGAVAAVNCGDSRIFQFDADRKGRQLSHDQTLGAEIRKVSPNGFADLPDARYEDELANFIGIGRDIQPEFLGMDAVGHGDAIVLASDGIWNAVGDTLFFKILLAAPTFADAVRRLLATVNFADGPDNASIAVISSRSEVSATLKTIQTSPDMVRIIACTPSGSVTVVTHFPLRSSSDSQSQAAGDSAKENEASSTPAIPGSKTLTPTSSKKRRERSRRGKHKRTAQAALDLDKPAENDSSGQKTAKPTDSKVEVVRVGTSDGSEHSSS